MAGGRIARAGATLDNGFAFAGVERLDDDPRLVKRAHRGFHRGVNQLLATGQHLHIAVILFIPGSIQFGNRLAFTSGDRGTDDAGPRFRASSTDSHRFPKSRG